MLAAEFDGRVKGEFEGVVKEHKMEPAQEATPVIDLVKAKNYEGLNKFITELEREVRRGKLGDVREIIANCVNEREAGTGDTSLHNIATSFTNLSTSVKIMNLLIAKGANVNALNNSKDSPINQAVMYLAHLSCGQHYGRGYDPENTSKLLPDLASGKIPIPANLLHALKVHMGLLIKAGCNIKDLTNSGLTTFQLMKSFVPAEIRPTINEASLTLTYERYMRTNQLQQYDFQRQEAAKSSCIIL